MRKWMREISGAIVVMALLLLGIAISGDAEYGTMVILTKLQKLTVLLVWAFVAGRILDLANGDDFESDKVRIDEGNLAVALSRTGGFAVLVGAGAIVLAGV